MSRGSWEGGLLGGAAVAVVTMVVGEEPSGLVVWLEFVPLGEGVCRGALADVEDGDMENAEFADGDMEEEGEFREVDIEERDFRDGDIVEAEFGDDLAWEFVATIVEGSVGNEVEGGTIGEVVI